MYAKINIAYNNVKKVSEDGTGSRHPMLGDVGRSTYLNFLDLVGEILPLFLWKKGCF